ncbi:ATP-binding protein [Streptomyces albipurpureus]|uniref:ATP-binding protein n=1 Tax=Streptomyces albipurpureus TaxID=2897419 RepID=A0ABT0UFC4_9ACTN|nr:ATP-binding protein [Streptomyces sp. CWNU-1]MCM2387307.1 ATP-binding protein [Streptomyces sp. CWNU-1]
MHFSTPQLPVTVRMFTRRLSATRRGAHDARQLTVTTLRGWDVSSSVTDRAEHIVAELAANAAVHALVRGRGFRLGLRLDTTTGTLRLELTDARGDRALVPPGTASADSESGRGLLLVGALADRWGSEPYPPSGKTVWAEIDSDRF